MDVRKAQVQGPRDSKTPSPAKQQPAQPSRVLDPRREIEDFEPTPAPTATPEVQEGMDLPVYVMDGLTESSVCERQLNFYSPQGTGRYCRPPIFAQARLIQLNQYGALKITWQNGRETTCPVGCVKCFTVD